MICTHTQGLGGGTNLCHCNISMLKRNHHLVIAADWGDASIIFYCTRCATQLPYPTMYCCQSDYSDSHHRGCTEVFKKLRRKGKTEPQKGEPKAPTFKSGWIPFMQDILSSWPAARRKGKQLYTAPMSEKADKPGRQTRGVRRSRPQPRGCFLSEWNQRTSQRSLFSGKGGLQFWGVIIILFFTLWSYMFCGFGWSLENFSGHGACGSISAAPGTVWIWWHGDGERSCSH